MPAPSISHVTARQEVRRLAVALGLEVPAARSGIRVSDENDDGDNLLVARASA